MTPDHLAVAQHAARGAAPKCGSAANEEFDPNHLAVAQHAAGGAPAKRWSGANEEFDPNHLKVAQHDHCLSKVQHMPPPEKESILTSRSRPLLETESTMTVSYRWPQRETTQPELVPECKFVTTSTQRADFHIKGLDVRPNPKVIAPKNERPFDPRSTYGTHYSENIPSNYNSETKVWDKTH